MERLQKVIANYGYTSRRNAEKLILEGRVKVNNEKVTILGTQVEETDRIKIDDVEIKQARKVYYLLNKPRGVITSASDDKNRKTVVDLIKETNRIYPVGRLDYDTTGALILTNDGDLANYLTHPKNEIEKVYVAKVRGILDMKALHLLKNGVYIDNIKTSPAKVKIKKTDDRTNTTLVQITIHEGKNHQIKKMIEAVGYEVLKLKRERIGFLTLYGLSSGCYRKLTLEEVNELKKISLK